MKIRLVVRGFADRKQIFEDRLEVDSELLDAAIPDLAEKHAQALKDQRLHMVEIEFVDDPNQAERFIRFGTDPSGMVMPIQVDMTGGGEQNHE